MNNNNYKIGFSNIGGIYIGKGIQSESHKHYAISIILSFNEAFEITTLDNEQHVCKAAIIQKNISYSLKSQNNNFIAFVHIVPHSEIGIKFSNRNNLIKELPIQLFENILVDLKKWFRQKENETNKVEYLLNLLCEIISRDDEVKPVFDERIIEAIDLISQSDDEKLNISKIANSVRLSSSHFARLLKKETGLTFREFVLQSKLTKSIYAMYKSNSLTEASFIGGFADQPHFSRTFKNAFGLKPSHSRK